VNTIEILNDALYLIRAFENGGDSNEYFRDIGEIKEAINQHIKELEKPPQEWELPRAAVHPDAWAGGYYTAEQMHDAWKSGYKHGAWSATQTEAK